MSEIPIILYEFINHQIKNNNKIINLSKNNYKVIINGENMKKYNNTQSTNCSNYSYLKNVISNIIQINQSNILNNNILQIIYNNKFYFSESISIIYYELYLLKNKDNQIYYNKSNNEYHKERQILFY